MNGRETIFSILNYYNENKIDFDVYIVADAQFKTCKYMSEQIIHADENEFFSSDGSLAGWYRYTGRGISCDGCM